jgi:hypothetical protein
VFDSEYFRTILQADVDAMGGSAVVEIHLLNGQAHRLHSVLSVHTGYATFEAYKDSPDAPTRRPRWKEEVSAGETPHETQRAVIPYEGIVNVAISAARPEGAGRIGFSRK